MNTDIHLHLQNEFWTNSSEPEKDRETISKLYIEGLLNVTSPARISGIVFVIAIMQILKEQMAKHVYYQ